MQKGIRRKLTGRSRDFWHKVDLATKEVESWPAWKREYGIERRGTPIPATESVRKRHPAVARLKPRR